MVEELLHENRRMAPSTPFVSFDEMPTDSL